jgi:hypothetical protein
MTANPIRPGSNEREALARLLPRPAERDLPSDRHRQLQEFVMSQIQQDLQRAAQQPRRSPRRLAYLASALAAGAAVAVTAAVAGTGILGSSGTPVPPGASTGAAPALASGRQILLAAATTAEKLSDQTGAYWYTKVVGTGAPDGNGGYGETWTAWDGRTWTRYHWRFPEAEKASPSAFQRDPDEDKVIEMRPPHPFLLGGAKVTMAQLQTLPTEPAALKKRIATLIRTSDIRTSAGRLTAAEQREAVFEGLVSLISLLPVPPKVRAAALRVIATYPNVTDLGAVEGGRGLLISFFPDEAPARLVIDPRTGQIRQTDVLVYPFSGIAGYGGILAVTAGWTDTLPQ